MANTRKTGSFHGKSNALGHGGRAAQLKAQGVPGGVIGEIARKKGAAPGGPNYHPSKPKASKMPKLPKPPSMSGMGSGKIKSVMTDRGAFGFKANRKGE